MPPDDRAATYLQASRNARQFANFGPCHYRAVDRLQTLLGGYPILTSTGTAAIEIALRSLGLAPRARVLIPDFTHVGTLTAIVRAGLIPVLSAVDKETWTLSPKRTARAFAAGLFDAAVVVNPFGYGVDFADWTASNVPIVYDFAGAWGNHPAMALAPVCYSLHATKNLGIGEGGIIWYPRTMGSHSERARRLTNFDINLDRSIGSMAGGNAKLDELRCAYLLAALEPAHLEAVAYRISAKRATLRTYLSMLPSAVLTAEAVAPSLCVLGNLPAAELEAATEAQGCAFRLYYPLLSRMPALRSVMRISESGDEMTRCCALPSDVDIHEIAKVVDIVRSYL